MITDKLKTLAHLKAQTAKLEASLAESRPAALAALPAEFGFADLKSFIKALQSAASAKPKAIAMPVPPPSSAPTARNSPVSAAIRMPVRSVFIVSLSLQ